MIRQFFEMRNSAFPAVSCPFIASYNVNGIVGAVALGLHNCMDQPFSIPYCIYAIPQHPYPTLHFFMLCEKHKLYVTGYAIVLAMISAGYFISFTRRATDFLEQKVL